jgi:hypothetical protein
LFNSSLDVGYLSNLGIATFEFTHPMVGEGVHSLVSTCVAQIAQNSNCQIVIRRLERVATALIE